jgi:diguanylate cyclase (GGDEF)-like protein
MNMKTFLEWNQTLSLPLRYLIASCIVATACATRYFGMPIDSGNQTSLFYPAVALSFLIGGSGPGIFSIFASALLAVFFFYSPYYSFEFNPDSVVPLLLFVFTSLAFGFVISAMRDFRMQSIAFDESLLGPMSGRDEEMLRLATDGARVGFWRWNILDDTVLLSDVSCAFYGMPPQTLSMKYSDFISRIIPEDRDWVLSARESSFITKKDFRAEFRVVWPDGTIHWVSSIGRPHFAANGILDRMDFVMLDISQRKSLEHRIAEIDLSVVEQVRAKTEYLTKANDALTALSQHDILTGLANRRGIDKHIRSAFARLKRYQETYAVLMLDIDFFKKVNDAFGHKVGDEVLQLLSRTLTKNLRESDFVGRYGGEEFLIVMPSASLDQAARVAEKLRSVVAATRHPVAGIVTASIGVAVASPDQDDEHAAIAEADRRMYAAKHAGRNRVCARGVPWMKETG